MSRTYAVGYARVSTAGQEDRHGLDAQEDGIRALMKREGFTALNGVLRETANGDLPAEERPLLAEALALVRDGHAAVLVVDALDRLDRTLTGQEATLALVWQGGGRVFTRAGEVPRDDPDDPMRTAMRQMQGVFAQLEKATIKARMRAGKRAKAARGGYVGGRPPFGWRAQGGQLVEVTTEQAVIRTARRKRKQGWSLEQIAAWLQRETAHRPRGGGNWTKVAVWRLLGEDRDRAA